MLAATITRVTDEEERECWREAAAGDEAAWPALTRGRALALGSSTWMTIRREDAGALAAERAGWRQLTITSRNGERLFVYGALVATFDDAVKLSIEVPGSVVVDIASGLKFASSKVSDAPLLLGEGWPDELTVPPRILSISRAERSLLDIARSNFDAVLRQNKRKHDKSLETAEAARREIEGARDAFNAALHGIYASRGYPRIPGGKIQLTDDGLVYEREGECPGSTP